MRRLRQFLIGNGQIFLLMKHFADDWRFRHFTNKRNLVAARFTLAQRRTLRAVQFHAQGVVARAIVLRANSRVLVDYRQEEDETATFLR